jgi:pyridoxal 5'-phosphate synthase pdxT subunit
MMIGVLALHGDFAEHMTMLRRMDVRAVEVRVPDQLHGLDGLIIPGGESTTMGKLAVAYNLIQPLIDFGRSKAVWGTCAGAIFLSKNALHPQPLLGLMDIEVERNAFGRQVDSFETNLDVPALRRVDTSQKPYPAVFIRAPRIHRVGKSAEVLASLPDGSIVAVQQGCWLATAFHPELTEDDRFHRYFLTFAHEPTA